VSFGPDGYRDAVQYQSQNSRVIIKLSPVRLLFDSKKECMKKLILFILSGILPLFIFTQTTTVSGTVTGGEGQVLRIITFDDFISKKIITLGEGKISEDGSFTMEFDLGETVGAFLDINYQRAEIFIEPGATYVLNIGYDPANQLASYFDRQGLLFEFSETNESELNRLIWRFNTMYNKFVMENFEHIVKLHDKARVAEFREQVNIEFDGNDHPYFKDYITYKLADVYQFARLKGKQTLAKEYFTDKPVLYNNVEYTFFFNEFFEKFLTTTPDVITISDLIIAVNDHQSNQMIIDALTEVPYLQDEGFRELVLIHGLRSLYFNGTYKKSQLLAMIKEINTSTNDEMHHTITANLLERLTHLAPGTPAPDIRVISIGGQEFNIKGIKSKPILLHFYRSEQKGTENAFERMTELHNYYQSGLEIISISMDNDPAAYLPLANSGGYRWTFAHYGNDPAIFDRYNIRDLPLYVLIDVEGNIALYPAPPPGEALEKEVKKVVH